MKSDPIVVERPYVGCKLPFGISGILRLKNAATTVEEVIVQFIPHLDGIVAVYADCDDSTPEILKRLEQRYPDKLRVYEYPSSVAAITTREHHTFGRLSPESIANYYNWAFQKASYSVVTKIDHDHLPFGFAFADAVAMLRKERPQFFLYTYSGLNLAKTASGEMAVPACIPLVGLGVHWFFDLAEDIYFEHLPKYENLVYAKERQKKHLGILYWHIKQLLPGYAPCRGHIASEGSSSEPEKVIEWKTFLKNSANVFSFYGHRIRGTYQRAFEGRPRWFGAILLLFPNLRGIRKKPLYQNICQLEELPDPPQEIHVGGRTKKLTELE